MFLSRCQSLSQHGSIYKHVILVYHCDVTCVYVTTYLRVFSVPMNTPSLLPRLPRNLKQSVADNEDEPEVESSANNEASSASEQSEQTTEDKTDNQTLLRLLEDGDKVRERCVGGGNVMQVLDTLFHFKYTGPNKKRNRRDMILAET